MFKKIVLVWIVLGLQGCASAPPKPELTEAGYTQFANWVIGGRMCVQDGFIQPELAAFGETYLVRQLQGYTYSPEKLNTVIAQTVKDTPEGVRIPQSLCNAAALNMAKAKQQYADNEASSQALSQMNAADAQLIQSTAIKNTWCNKVGAQTMCSTY